MENSMEEFCRDLSDLELLENIEDVDLAEHEDSDDSDSFEVDEADSITDDDYKDNVFWMQAIPLKQTIILTFDALSNSEDMKDHHLYEICRKIFALMKEEHEVDLETLKLKASVSSKEVSSPPSDSKLLKIFETAFLKIIPSIPENGSVASLAEEVLDEYDKENGLDLSGSKVIAALIQYFPSKFSQVVETSIEVGNPGVLVPLCQTPSFNFMKIVNHLYKNSSLNISETNRNIIYLKGLFASLYNDTNACSHIVDQIPIYCQPCLQTSADLYQLFRSKNLSDKISVNNPIIRESLLDCMEHSIKNTMDQRLDGFKVKRDKF